MTLDALTAVSLPSLSAFLVIIIIISNKKNRDTILQHFIRLSTIQSKDLKQYPFTKFHCLCETGMNTDIIHFLKTPLFGIMKSKHSAIFK